MTFLKEFQTDVYNEVLQLLNEHGEVMLAACTGFGKTEVICQFVKDHPKLRVLILAHGQRTLRMNFSDRLEKHRIKCFEMQSSNKQNIELANKSKVVVALPQNIHNNLKQLKAFDIIAVDESHEFYASRKGAKMYPKIKIWHNKGKWILLSASHYRLDKHKVFFSRENALNVGQITDATVKLIEEKSVKIKDSDISSDGMLNAAIKVPTSVRVIANVLNSQGHTPAIIAKHSAAAAHELYKDLKKVYKGKICISEHATDLNSDKLSAFKNGKYDVCIVVYRGNLGFDYPAMTTFIDGSYTTNIPRMEQMLGRVVRIYNNKPKTFIKLVPANAWSRGILLGTAVLALSKDEVYREWKGDEGKIKLPGKPADIIDNLNKHTTNVEYGEGGEVVDNTDNVTVTAVSEGGVLNISAAETTDNDKENKEVGARKPKMRTRKTLKLSFGHLIGMFEGKDRCTLRQAINYAGVGSGIDSESKKQEILDFVKKYGRRPSSSKTEEKKLRQVMDSYTRTTHGCYDPEFTKKLNELVPVRKNSHQKK